MPENLYRSYSLEKSLNNGDVITSGTITTWEDRPVSSLDVGDKFRPVPNGPLLTVKKVNISDNVIGTIAGKPVRQWQISLEGNNEDEASSASQTHILYNFSFNANERSGTMEVTNTGDAPSISLNIGDSFRVPGVGNIPCVNVKGNDTYDDNGNHIWSVTYEGSDAENEQDALSQNRYTFSIEKNDSEVVHSGSVSIASKGDTPILSYEVGSKIHIPGIGEVKCSKISANDDYSYDGSHVWTVTYEGSDEDNSSEQQDEALPRIKYSFSIDKDGSSSVSSGTMQVVNKGSAPVFSLSVGNTFPFPGLGNLTCTSISGDDSYSEKGTRLWTVTYEGIIEQPTHPKYSFSIDKDSSSSFSSGTMQVTNEGNSPNLSINIGESFNVPGLGNITCTNISGSDEYSESGIRRWNITYESSNKFVQLIKYSFSIDKDGKSSTKSATMQVINEGSSPTLSLDVGQAFNVPGLGDITCTSISSSDEYSDSGIRIWNTTYEGSIEQVQQPKYSLALHKDGSLAATSGSMQVINEGDTPTLSINIGQTFNVPGLGEITCTNISASDEYSDSGARRWVVTYEGSDEALHQVKYSFSIDKDGASSISSGSMQVINEGESPTLSLNIGQTFSIPGIGDMTCINISGSDEYSESGLRIWTVTYEGAIEQTQQPKYSFSIEKDGKSSISSGTIQVINEGDTPTLNPQIGGTLTIPGLGEVTCTSITANDEYSESGTRRWIVTYESNTEQTQHTKYSFSIKKDGDSSVSSASMQVVSEGDTPTLSLNVGQNFNVPGLGEITCTNITANDEYSESGTRIWTVTYEGSTESQTSGGEDSGSSGGSGSSDDSSTANEENVSYELNGITVRTVTGELLVLRRSQTPISKKSITVYNNSESRLTTIGSEYNNQGIAISENISKETIKVNGNVTKTQYKHVIEVES